VKSPKIYADSDDFEAYDFDPSQELLYIDIKDIFGRFALPSPPPPHKTPPDALVIPGPLRATSKGDNFGKTWWGRQWIAALKTLGADNRLTKGRTYARNGSVRSLEISKGLAFSPVQGSFPLPYQTEISITPFTDAEWNTLLTALSSQLIFAAKLLAGEMPAEIEELMKEFNLSLFPRSLKDIEFTCSCPDYGSPCKHAAAVYYHLAEQIDANPFALFHLRGRTREQVLATLRQLRGDGTSPDPALLTAPMEAALDADLDAFWSFPAPLPALHLPTLPETPAVFRELGELTGDEGKALREVYRDIAQTALATLLSQDTTGDQPTAERE
jgi:uncharacterized Zn finger protein